MRRPAWDEVKTLCRRLDRLLYTEHNEDAAIKELPLLRQLLATLPPYGGAIVREEACALCAELEGDYLTALENRRSELLHIKLLHKDVAKNDYDDALKATLLKGYGSKAVARREEIIKRLKAKIAGA